MRTCSAPSAPLLARCQHNTAAGIIPKAHHVSAGHCVWILSEMSSACTECVSAPTEMYVTPVDAISLTDRSVTLPDASVSTAPM